MMESRFDLNDIKKIAKYPFRVVKDIKKANRIRKHYCKLVKHYDDVIDLIRCSERDYLRFAAYVVFDSVYSADGLFALMMKSQRWKPCVVVIPDISRGKEHMLRTYSQTKDFFIKKYGIEYVLDGYDEKNGEYIDYSEEFDIVYCANPYDSMVADVHSIKYLSERNCLPIYFSYGYDIGLLTTKWRLKGPELNYLWKCFTDTTYSHTDYERYQIIKGKNTELVGYSKMDTYRDWIEKDCEKQKTKILISSHHTVASKELPLSNFMEYSEVIFELKRRFPNIDFVFRPHPLLFTNLVNNGIWTQDEVDNYLNRLGQVGVEYSYGGDYFNLFSECDAIINDCGSFTIEWLFTGKPGCFVRNHKLKNSMLTTLMNKAISGYDVAESKEDIIDFVSKIEKGIYHEKGIENWVRDNIILKYPTVSEHILEVIDIMR